MKKEVKLMRQAIKEKNIRNLLAMLNILTKEDLESVDEQTGFNIIHLCAQENAANELLLIMNHLSNIDLNLKSLGIVQKTALDIAVNMGNKEVSKILIQYGALFKNPKEIKNTFRNDTKFLEIVNEAFQKTMINSNKKKKGFFSFG